MRNAIPEKRESRLMSGKLMYMQIEQEIRERIRSGVYAPESQLPTENELGREFGVSRLTVSKSLANLVKENLISRTRGRGFLRQRPAPGSAGEFRRSGFGARHLQVHQSAVFQRRRYGTQPPARRDERCGAAAGL